jgi:hypothetical protein
MEQMANLVQMAKKVNLVPRVPLLELWRLHPQQNASVAHQALRDPQLLLDHLDPLDPKVDLDLKVVMESQAAAPQVQLATQAPLVPQAAQALLATRAQTSPLEARDLQAPLETGEILVQLATTAIQDPLATQDLLAQLVPLALLAPLDRALAKAPLVHLVNQAPLAQMPNTAPAPVVLSGSDQHHHQTSSNPDHRSDPLHHSDHPLHVPLVLQYIVCFLPLFCNVKRDHTLLL